MNARISSSTVASSKLETEGNEVATGFQSDGKTAAVCCWLKAVERSGISDKVLAADARMSRGHFSKVSNGVQGDLLSLVYRVGRKHPELRLDFFCRLAEAEGADPIVMAAQQLAAAALRFLTLRSRTLPTRADRVAKAGLPVTTDQAVNG
jgi:AraC-like DNA-binding protein